MLLPRSRLTRLLFIALAIFHCSQHAEASSAPVDTQGDSNGGHAELPKSQQREHSRGSAEGGPPPPHPQPELGPEPATRVENDTPGGVLTQQLNDGAVAVTVSQQGSPSVNHAGTVSSQNELGDEPRSPGSHASDTDHGADSSVDSVGTGTSRDVSENASPRTTVPPCDGKSQRSEGCRAQSDAPGSDVAVDTDDGSANAEDRAHSSESECDSTKENHPHAACREKASDTLDDDQRGGGERAPRSIFVEAKGDAGRESTLEKEEEPVVEPTAPPEESASRGTDAQEREKCHEKQNDEPVVEPTAPPSSGTRLEAHKDEPGVDVGHDASLALAGSVDSTSEHSSVAPAPPHVDANVAPAPPRVDANVAPAPPRVDANVAPAPPRVDANVAPAPPHVDETESHAYAQEHTRLYGVGGAKVKRPPEAMMTSTASGDANAKGPEAVKIQRPPEVSVKPVPESSKTCSISDENSTTTRPPPKSHAVKGDLPKYWPLPPVAILPELHHLRVFMLKSVDDAVEDGSKLLCIATTHALMQGMMGNYFSRISLTTLTLAMIYKPCDVIADRIGYWAGVIWQTGFRWFGIKVETREPRRSTQYYDKGLMRGAMLDHVDNLVEDSSKIFCIWTHWKAATLFGKRVIQPLMASLPIPGAEMMGWWAETVYMLGKPAGNYHRCDSYGDYLGSYIADYVASVHDHYLERTTGYTPLPYTPQEPRSKKPPRHDDPEVADSRPVKVHSPSSEL